MINDILHKRPGSLLVAALALAGSIASQQAASGGQFLGIGGNKGVTYKTYRDPAGRFEFDYPTKDWKTLAGAGTALAQFARNDGGATFAIDHTQLSNTIPSSDLAYTTMAEVEVDDLKARSPQNKNFTSELVETKGGRGALIKYTQAGAKGPERVMQFSIPLGKELFRVIGTVPESQAVKHEATVLHMIESFKAPAGTTETKG